MTRRSLTIASAAVFAFFFLIFLSIQFRSPSLTSQDDGYYHVRHALEYCGAEPIPMPVLSTMSTYRTDLYFGYHVLMCPFLLLVPGEGPDSDMAAAKIFNATLAGLYMAVMFALAASIFSRMHPGGGKSILFASFFMTAFLFVISPNFMYRLVFLRPFFFSSLCVLLAYYLIFRKSYVLLFALSAAITFFYSVSFVVLFPALMYIAAYALYYGRRSLTTDTFKPLLVTATGLAAGILLHPDLYAYIYNGYYIHLRAIFNRFAVSSVPEGTEMYAASWSVAADFLWLVPIPIIAAITIIRYGEKKSLAAALSFPMFFHIFQTVVLLAGFFFIQRISEYFFPYAALLVFWYGRDALSNAAAWVKKQKEQIDEGSTVHPLEAALIETVAGVNQKRNIVAGIAGIFLAIMFAVTYGNALVKASAEQPLDGYLEAAEFLKSDSEPGSLVFLPTFDQYPRLVFTNDHNRYTMGMGSIFTYAYDPEAYWIYYNTVAGNPICPKKECEEEEAVSVYDALAERLGASYVFINTSGTVELNGTDFSLTDALDADPRATKAFISTTDPNIIIYKL